MKSFTLARPSSTAGEQWHRGQTEGVVLPHSTPPATGQSGGGQSSKSIGPFTYTVLLPAPTAMHIVLDNAPNTVQLMPALYCTYPSYWLQPYTAATVLPPPVGTWPGSHLHGFLSSLHQVMYPAVEMIFWYMWSWSKNCTVLYCIVLYCTVFLFFSFIRMCQIFQWSESVYKTLQWLNSVCPTVHWFGSVCTNI